MGVSPSADAAVSEAVLLLQARRHTRTTDRRGYRPAPFVSDSVLGVQRGLANDNSLAITAKKFCELRAVGQREGGGPPPFFCVALGGEAVLAGP